MKDDLRYTPSDCFETFPFPVGWDSDPDKPASQDRNPNLQAAGKEYYEFRAALMVRNNEGLTKTYNRFHDPAELAPDIQRLRELHHAMDVAALRFLPLGLFQQTANPSSMRSRCRNSAIISRRAFVSMSALRTSA